MNYEQQALELIKENEALKAQVNHVKGIALSWIHDQLDGTSSFDGEFEEVNKTPEQCLNSVKADAINEFWTSMLLECLGSDNGVDAVLDSYTNDNLLTPVKEYYVSKLRGKT